MALFTRKQYMNKEVDHQTYYGQFATDSVRRIVCQYIGRNRILASRDPFFNDIPLRLWDGLHGSLTMLVGKRIAVANGSGGVSLSDTVCVAKAAARIEQEQAIGEVRLAKVREYEQATGHRCMLPDVHSFDDLFTIIPDREVIDTRIGPLSTYLEVKTLHSHLSHNARPSEQVVEAVCNRLIPTDAGAYFKVTLRDDGYARVFAIYQAILGQHLVAFITNASCLEASTETKK